MFTWYYCKRLIVLTPTQDIKKFPDTHYRYFLCNDPLQQNCHQKKYILTVIKSLLALKKDCFLLNYALLKKARVTSVVI